MLSRRAVNLGILATAGLAAGATRVAAAELKTIDLPPPWKDGGKPLAQAVWARRSIREFADKPVPIEVLSNLLWTACGVNRPATVDRTVPSWRHAIESEIFVAAADGAWRYDARAHRLIAGPRRRHPRPDRRAGLRRLRAARPRLCRRWRPAGGRLGRRETLVGLHRRRLHRPERLPVLRLRRIGDGVSRLARPRSTRADAAACPPRNSSPARRRSGIRRAEGGASTSSAPAPHPIEDGRHVAARE